MFVCNVCLALVCTSPTIAPFDEIGYEKFVKRAAYASFIAEKCGVENDIDVLNEQIFAKLKSDSMVQNSIFREKRKFFKNDSNFLSVFKRCYLVKSETVAFVAKVEESLKKYNHEYLVYSDKIHRLQSDYSACIFQNP